MTINLFDHEELGDIQPLKDILASPIFDRLDLQGQIKYIINENSRLKAMITDIKDELKDWKADAERLSKTFVIEVYPHEWVCRSGCHHMGKSPATIDHAPDCPITLHRALEEKYGTGNANKVSIDCNGIENPVSDADISG